jgi:hypothetical protein
VTQAEARERVARGAGHLDTTRPGWAHEIRVDVLDLKLCVRCIVGQLAGGEEKPYDFDERAGMLGILTRAVAAEHGFDLTTDEWRSGRESGPRSEELFGILQDAWIDAIADRVVPKAEAIGEAQPARVNAG